MRKLYPKLFTTLLAVATLLVNSGQLSHAQNSATEIYAITNARIVTVSGPVIERGTLVIRNGLIQAAGANVAAPADAQVIDGAGLTIYPGLIDGLSSFGIPVPQPSPSPAGPGQAGQRGQSAAALQTTSFASPNSTQPPGLQPEVYASDQIRAGGDQFDAAHAAGITTALTAPREGIFMGQSAMINLAGETPQKMIVKSPMALHVGFTPLRTGGYPNSLMGVFSAVRQMLLDAERYREANQIYEKSPRGLRRPDQDKSLEALLPVLSGAIPVIMIANSERELIRALDLAKEFKLKAIIAGGEESWRVTDRLREQNVPVLLSLNFPRRTSALLPEADPDSMRVLRARVNAPRTAGKLAAAHVRFAFESGSMTNLEDFLGNALKTVEGGLSRDEALRALTLNGAQILGLDDRLGSIEAGKIANLTIVRGDIFDRKPKVAQLFIDGRSVEIKAAATAASQTGQSGMGGSWALNVNLGEGDVGIILTLQQEGDTLTGSMQGALGSNQIAGASAGPGGEIRFTVPITLSRESKQTTEATFTGSVTGNEMRGTVQIVGRSPGTFTGTRPK